jgi:hypothetical protein
MSIIGRTNDVSAAAIDNRGARVRRVTVLLWAIVILSLADLAVTIGHLQSVGMAEANPVAAYLIRVTDSPWALAAFKALTVAVCVALLYSARRHWQGEVASWLALTILVGVSILWHYYAEALDDANHVRLAQVVSGDDWLQFD